MSETSRKSSVSTLPGRSSISLGAAARHTPDLLMLPLAVKDAAILDATGHHILYEGPGMGAFAPVMLSRVAACVNALAGIPHPEHLPELITALGLLDNMTSDEFACGADKPIRDALAKMRGD